MSLMPRLLPWQWPPAEAHPCLAQTMWKDLKRRVPLGKGLPPPPQPGATSKYPGLVKIKDGWAAVTLDVAHMQRAVTQPDEADPPYFGTCTPRPSTLSSLLVSIPASLLCSSA